MLLRQAALLSRGLHVWPGGRNVWQRWTFHVMECSRCEGCR